MNVTARLNHLLMPLDRGERYEDPLQDALAARGFGSVDGGGTMMLQSGEVEFVDVEVILTNDDEGIPFVIATLEERGAPKGSMLQIHEAAGIREVPFGKAEGVGIYLDGVNLPAEVYADSDVNVVVEELNRSIEGVGELQSYWEGPTETALYFYGPNAEEMKRRMAGFLARYPLCAGARVVTIAPRQDRAG